MKKLFCLFSIAMLMSIPGYGDQLVRSGNFIIEENSGSKTIINDEVTFPVFLSDTVEWLTNGDFETGTMPPWESYAWQVVDTDSHTGQYCAADVGNNWMRQNIAPVLTDSIVSVTFWSRQPEATIQAFDFIYNDSTYYENIIWNQVYWQMHDVTSYLPSGKTMVAFRLWGYSGGGPLPDSTYTDDVSILVETPGTDVRERNAAARRMEFNIYPNPVREKAVIECSVMPGERPLLSIYDINGSLIEQAELENGKYVWHTKGINAGVYFIRVQTDLRQGSGRKLLVLK